MKVQPRNVKIIDNRHKKFETLASFQNERNTFDQDNSESVYKIGTERAKNYKSQQMDNSDGSGININALNSMRVTDTNFNQQESRNVIKFRGRTLKKSANS